MHNCMYIASCSVFYIGLVILVQRFWYNCSYSRMYILRVSLKNNFCGCSFNIDVMSATLKYFPAKIGCQAYD